MIRLQLTDADRATFHDDGFVLIRPVLDAATIAVLRHRFDRLFHGEFETGVTPDEVNWQFGESDPTLTRQICNGWRADRTVAATICRPDFGHVLAELMGWPGTRVMIDNILWKPPGARSLGFHQDNAYLSWFEPSEIVTLWLALDDTSADGGTLELVPGSHRWPASPPTEEFHAPADYRASVRAAAAATPADAAPAASASAASAASAAEFETVPVEVRAGAGSIHHGWTWHGSGPNTRSTSRRALVLHAMSSEAQFQPDHFHQGTGPIYSKHAQPGTTDMPEDVFPTIWSADAP